MPRHLELKTTSIKDAFILVGLISVIFTVIKIEAALAKQKNTKNFQCEIHMGAELNYEVQEQFTRLIGILKVISIFLCLQPETYCCRRTLTT